MLGAYPLLRTLYVLFMFKSSFRATAIGAMRDRQPRRRSKLGVGPLRSPASAKAPRDDDSNQTGPALTCTMRLQEILMVMKNRISLKWTCLGVLVMPTLRQLRYLDALARQGNFVRAAEECGISQPALSMQIHELELELGAELVARSHGVTALTEAGTEVARRASSILSATRDLADCVRHRGAVLSGTLRVGIIPTLAPYVLPSLLPVLHRAHPDLCLDLLETHTKTLVSELTEGTLDVLLLALPLEKPEFESIVLFTDRFLLVVPADDPLPERARVTPRDVNARRLLLLEEGHCLREQALSYCGTRDATHPKLGATSLATVLQMVASGYGVTLLPEVAVDVEVRDERVKLLRFAEPQPQRQIGLAWRPTSARKSDFLELGQILLGALKCEQSHKAALRAAARPANAGNG
jgi:LysR family transcriptional regulator, hydrogen peroxide-inducible genes activator